ncbi:MAG TPA: hypothetical protein VF049_15200 [Nocardioidaceae bacterium]|jgi:hypothetical protein
MTTIEDDTRTEETTHGDRRADGSGSAARPGGLVSPRLSRAMAAVLAGLVAVALVVLALELLVLRPRYQDVQSQKQARTDVVRVAQRFTVEVNNYDAKSIDGYKQRIAPMLSTRFRGEFDHAMKDIMASVKQTDMSSKGQVLASGVASLDPDSAEVLVVSDAEVKTVFDTRVRHFRWEVSLVKVDGRWLVDDFSPVA